eukprot:Phypoly_transcript_23599.p1 GENE.Phypoly_transcript_23599~~Phypoly_transcript_23599.p1  ORF type:complete len:174 (+),score=35.74 Phypoly_transcript_23599:41-523(+)
MAFLENRYVTVLPDKDYRVEFDPPRDVEVSIKTTSSRTQNVWISSDRKDDLVTGKGKRLKDGEAREIAKKTLKNVSRLFVSFDFAGSDPRDYTRSAKSVFDPAKDIYALLGTAYIVLRGDNLEEKVEDPGLPNLPDAPGLDGAIVYLTFKPLEAELAQIK